VVTFAAGCRPGRQGAERGDQVGERHLAAATLVRQLRQQVLSPEENPDSTNVHVAATPSSTVPGLTYYWGSFRPKRSVHVFHYTVVAGRGGTVVPISEDHSWMQLIRDWRPASDDQAIAFCGELDRAFADVQDPVGLTRPYHADSSFNGLLLPDSIGLARLLSPPEVRREAGDWQVRLWLLTSPTPRRVRCDLVGGVWRVLTIDSAPNLGPLKF
jgi:hypothetical protein